MPEEDPCEDFKLPLGSRTFHCNGGRKGMGVAVQRIMMDDHGDFRRMFQPESIQGGREPRAGRALEVDEMDDRHCCLLRSNSDPGFCVLLPSLDETPPGFGFGDQGRRLPALSAPKDVDDRHAEREQDDKDRQRSVNPGPDSHGGYPGPAAVPHHFFHPRSPPGVVAVSLPQRR
jgi:hypothetical protein